jgi:hypothetical protein
MQRFDPGLSSYMGAANEQEAGWLLCFMEGRQLLDYLKEARTELSHDNFVIILLWLLTT